MIIVAPHILVVDDDERIRKLLKRYLHDHTYLVSSAANLAECQQQLATFQFDLVIMDIMLPDGSGLDFINQHPLTVPVILLTAMGTADDRISGLESSAEDYIAKPFEPKELLLRIHKILQRQRVQANQTSWCCFGDCRFNLFKRTLLCDNLHIPLTTMESNILSLLAEHANKTISREEIAARSPGVNIRTIDAQIARVRAKIEKDPRNPSYLQTVRGKGYVLWGDLVLQ